MRMQEFKEGKIAVYAETKVEVERFLKACGKEGLRWNDGAVATERVLGGKAEIAYRFRDCHGLSWTGSGRGWHSRHPDPHRPYKSVTVGEFFGKRERVTIYRTADGRVECVHTLDDKEVGKTSVTRYYKDTDDFLTAAKFALGKLPAAEVTAGLHTYKVGDHVKVRSDLKVGDGQKGVATVVKEMLQYRGKTFTLTEDTGRFFRVKEASWAWTPEMFEGLADEPLPPFNKTGKPNYKVGQKVRMKEGYAYPEAFVGEIVAVEHDGRMTYRVREPNGAAPWQYNRNVLGLAE